jgi:quinol-cytochrome oxidoreductase complex cytochrome b subunit
MKKVPFVAAFWTFALALPFTILALAGVSYVDLHFSGIAQSISNFEREVSSNRAGLASELWARFPEVLGMVIGMIVIFTIFVFVRQSAQPVDQNKK